ncbi:AsmA-like C-terminal region-containing protein [Planctomycetes bacterium K23_9]|uniref:Putative assembly protein n=1 Tax=Stieleria marina TaxID=1930275 RepID=A0A517NRI5_9BACT|nr:putative assembly protein [Planctomycetes bacterium K23_9]
MRSPFLTQVIRLFILIGATTFVSSSSASAQEKTSYWNLSWSWKDVDVEQLSSRLSSVGLDIPVSAQGNASVDVQVGIPLNALRSSDKYQLTGTISSKRLQVDELVWSDFEAVIDVREGNASLQKMRGSLGSKSMQGSGRVTGSANLQFAPMGDVSAKLVMESVKISPLHQVYKSAIGDDSVSTLSGTVDGKIQFSAPYESIGDVHRWTLDADVSVDQFRSGQFPAVNLATGSATIRNGTLEAKNMRATVAGDQPSTLMAAARAELSGERRFQLGVMGDNVPLTKIAGLFSSSKIPWVTGQLDVDLTAKGRLGDGKNNWADTSELNWEVNGKIASPEMTASGVNLGLIEHQITFDKHQFVLTPLLEVGDNDKLLIKRIAAKYQVQPTSIALEQLAAEVFDGTLAGNAVLSTDGASPHHVDLKWNDLALQFDAGVFAPVSVAFQAFASGAIDWTVPAAGIAKVDQHRGKISVDLEQITVADASVGDLSVIAESTPNSIVLESQGKLFGGDWSIKTKTDVTPDLTFQDLWQAITTGQVSIASMQAERIIAVLPPALRPKLLNRRWRGKLNANVDFKMANGKADSTIKAVASNVSLDGTELTRRMKLNARIVDNRLVIDQAIGLIADGRLEASGLLVLEPGSAQIRSAQLNVRVASVDAPTILNLVAPNVAEQIDGRVSARLVVSGGDRDRLAIRGAVTLSDATTFGIRIDEAHSGISGYLTTRLDRWGFNIPSIAGSTGNGRIAGSLSLKSANRPSKVDMRSKWDLRNVDFAKTLANAESSSGILGEGRLSGKLVLNANHVSGPQDLFGNFDFKLNGSSGRSIPGLDDAQNFLGPIGLAGVRFDEGRARGVIGAGRATLQEFWLRSPQLMVWAEGPIVLANQRLDLQAVISTGNFDTSTTLISALGMVAVDYATPIGILLEINQLLSDRTIFVDVVGPASDPRLRLKPLETIREETAQFFLQQLLPVPCQFAQQQNPLSR